MEYDLQLALLQLNNKLDRLLQQNSFIAEQASAIAELEEHVMKEPGTQHTIQMIDHETKPKGFLKPKLEFTTFEDFESLRFTCGMSTVVFMTPPGCMHDLAEQFARAVALGES